MIPEIKITDYTYNLPESRIAKYPLPSRDSSKLLDCRGGEITEHVFRDIPSLLDDRYMMVFNDTKVVPARLHFQRESGAHIEVFCLDPHSPVEYNLIFAETSTCSWKCIVGNIKRWKGDTLYLCNPENDEIVNDLCLRARLLSREENAAIVEFSWNGGIPFSKVLEICGTVPIPPYLNRETESIDYERYQTLYAKYRGSVAAPTAGLHFTDDVLGAIRAKGVDMENVCLHVGAGTFLPVKSVNVNEHVMHREPFVVTLELLEKLRNSGTKVVAVGTTSVRTLESLYYAGFKCIEEGCPSDIGQWMPYEKDYQYTREQALDALIAWVRDKGEGRLSIRTRIIIVPGFEFKFTDVLVTNFHQPQSTLLLLISAFLKGNWKPVYDYALGHGFRFLSYGDSSILFR